MWWGNMSLVKLEELKDWCWSWNSNTLATCHEELTHLKRPWCWERLRAGGEGDDRDEMVGWYHRLYGHGFGWTLEVGDGQGGLACCGSWGRKESDMTEQLNWTENCPVSRWSRCDFVPDSDSKAQHPPPPPDSSTNIWPQAAAVRINTTMSQHLPSASPDSLSNLLPTALWSGCIWCGSYQKALCPLAWVWPMWG